MIENASLQSHFTKLLDFFVIDHVGTVGAETSKKIIDKHNMELSDLFSAEIYWFSASFIFSNVPR